VAITDVYHESVHTTLLYMAQVSGNNGETKWNINMTREWIGNQGEVTDLEIVSTSGRPSHLAVATNSAVVRIYNLASRGCEAALFGHSDMVLALDLVPAGDGQAILASASKDCTFRIWRLQVCSQL
jgi:WD40 repeat protein